MDEPARAWTVRFRDVQYLKIRQLQTNFLYASSKPSELTIYMVCLHQYLLTHSTRRPFSSHSHTASLSLISDYMKEKLHSQLLLTIDTM